MIRVSICDDTTQSTATADIPSEFGPSLRSAIQEIRDTLGGRVEGMFSFKKEHSLSRAVTAVGRLAAALNLVITEADPERRLVHEINGLMKAADGVPVAGYYSMGEVARVRGVRGMHHMTSVSLALG